MHAHYLTRACAWELEDRVAAYRELRAETRKSQLLIASVTREEVKRRGDTGLYHSSTGRGERISPARSVAAVGERRCVQGKLDIGSTRVDLIELARPSALRGLWLSPRPIETNSVAPAIKPRSLPLIVLSTINLRIALSGIAIRSQPSGGLRGRRGKPPQTRRGWLLGRS
jgi:hypothetical protein